MSNSRKNIRSIPENDGAVLLGDLNNDVITDPKSIECCLKWVNEVLFPHKSYLNED